MTINQSLTYPNWLNNVLNVQKFPISKLTPVRALNIYHNIRCPHRLRALQRVSEASGLKHTPFCDHIEKKRP